MSWPANRAPVPDDVWADWQNRFAESDKQAGFDISRDSFGLGL